jgi:hypothetical protein
MRSTVGHRSASLRPAETQALAATRPPASATGLGWDCSASWCLLGGRHEGASAGRTSPQVYRCRRVDNGDDPTSRGQFDVPANRLTSTGMRGSPGMPPPIATKLSSCLTTTGGDHNIGIDIRTSRFANRPLEWRLFGDRRPCPAEDLHRDSTVARDLVAAPVRCEAHPCQSSR